METPLQGAAPLTGLDPADLLRQAAADTLSDPDMVEQELRVLLGSFG